MKEAGVGPYHKLPDGRVYTNSGALDPVVLKRTFQEVSARRKAGIARGKAYFTTSLTLGQYIMMDFLRKRRKRAG